MNSFLTCTLPWVPEVADGVTGESVELIIPSLVHCQSMCKDRAGRMIGTGWQDDWNPASTLPGHSNQTCRDTVINLAGTQQSTTAPFLHLPPPPDSHLDGKPNWEIGTLGRLNGAVPLT